MAGYSNKEHLEYMIVFSSPYLK